MALIQWIRNRIGHRVLMLKGKLRGGGFKLNHKFLCKSRLSKGCLCCVNNSVKINHVYIGYQKIAFAISQEKFRALLWNFQVYCGEISYKSKDSVCIQSYSKGLCRVSQEQLREVI